MGGNRTYSSRRTDSRFSNNRSYGGGSRPARKGPKKDYIHPSKFVKVANLTQQEAYEPIHSFNDFEVEQIIKDNLAVMGYEKPSPIQDQTIPLGLAGSDVIGIANTGTGKTAAFAVPILNWLVKFSDAKAIIMAPTRELAQQIEAECRQIARGSGISGAVLIGGSSMTAQFRDLDRNPQIVIGTPGRIKDHIERGTLKIADFNIVVLDEVDRMLDMGFVNDMRTILSQVATERQSFFFSATLDNRVRDLISTFAIKPVTVSVKTGDTSDNVHQDIIPYSNATSKIDQLHETLSKSEVSKVLVFDETQRSVERLSIELRARGFKVDAIHGGKSQSQRQRALGRFKSSEINVLVATDVAARGIDVADITHVINYTTPQTYDDYIHRIGRAGRAGQIGYALTFVDQY